MGCKFYPAYPDEIIRLIGIVAIESAYLDLLLGEVLATTSGGITDGAVNPDYKIDTRRKIQKLEKCSDLPVQLSIALQGIPEILADRNYAIHGFGTCGAESFRGIEQHHALRGKYAGKNVQRDAAWLMNLIERISETNQTLVELCRTQQS